MADKRIPASEIRKVWLEPGLTTQQAADKVGLSRSNLWRRAKALGLPAKSRRTHISPLDCREFRILWDAGVAAADIANLFGVTMMHVCDFARGRQFPRRPRGHRPVSLAEYRSAQLVGAMRQAAAETRSAMRNAEMLDGTKNLPRAA